MKRFLAFGYGIVCYVIFFATFLYLVGFLANLFVPKSIDSGTPGNMGIALAINLGLLALFGIQHSVMARPAFKKAWTKVVPKSIERSTYVLISSLILILLYGAWQPMPQIVWQADATWVQAVLWGVFATGLLVVLLATFVIDHFDLFGLRQVTLNLLQKPYRHPGFKVTFFYKFVRHPIYVGWLLTFWGTPTMSWGHLLFAAGMTAYMLIAIRYEERDLEHFLGEDYRRYRQRVPMLVPGLKVHETVKPGGRTPSASHG